MGRDPWGPWRWLAAAVAVLAALLLAAVVWRSHHRSDLAVFGAFVIGMVGVAAAVVDWAKRGGTGRAGVAGLVEADLLADRLAWTVRDQWVRAAGERGLLEPEPIAVRWQRPSAPVTGPVSAAAGPTRFAPLPGLAAAGPRELVAGTVADLHGVYGGIGSGRLVITGPPGSGKTGAAVLLVLAALRHRDGLSPPRRVRVPVPVMFTLAGWDPRTQPVRDWLAARLRQAYPPLFASAAAAAALVVAGKVAVILDGLDEIPVPLRPVALRALSEQAGFRLVVLTRSAEMAAAAEQAHLEGAVAVELQQVSPADAVAYLSRVQLDPPPRGWAELTGRLRDTPQAPIAQALSSPLALSLVRDTYRSGDDVRGLLAFCDNPDVTADDITSHLLDRVLPSAYAPRPGRPPPPCTPQTAQNTLCRIAAQMNRDQTRDLQWWCINSWARGNRAPAESRSPRGVRIRRAAGEGLRSYVFSAWLTTAFPGGLFHAIVIMYWIAIARKGWIYLVSGAPALIVLDMLAVNLALASKQAGNSKGKGNVSVLGPLAAWRRDLRYGLVVGLVSGSFLWVAVQIFIIFVQHTPAGTLTDWLVSGLVIVPIGLISGVLFYSVTTPASLAFARLALTWRTPLRLLRFLEDARDRNVLRTVGPVYQFRHARLQDRLAAQAQPGRRPATPTAGHASSTTQGHRSP